MTPGETLYRFYRGESMQGTFLPGDYLLIVPVPVADIHPGDVIVYQSRHEPGSAEELVHRVVGVIAAGLVTRGDNSQHHDSGPVQPDQIVGKVFRFIRGHKSHTVTGGIPGLLYAELRRGWARLDFWMRNVFRRPYFWLRNSRVVHRFWHPPIFQLRVMTEKGPLVKYRYGNRTVAQWWVQEQRFDVVKPFDLIIPPPEN